jgi:hypothetical protein
VKKKSLPSAEPDTCLGASPKTLGKENAKKNLCRVPSIRHSTKSDHCHLRPSLPSAWRVPGHSPNMGFAECLSFLCRVSGTRQMTPLPSVFLCQVQRSAKKLFTECPIFGTRPRKLHLAMPLCPVVNGYGIRSHP